LDWFLRLPLVWGGVAALAYYAMLSQGVIDSPLLVRYTASHPVEYCETTMFFVGLAALAATLINLCGQFYRLNQVSLGPIPPGGQRTEDCDRLLEQLMSLPARVRQTYLARRLWEAVEFVRRRDAADDLDQHLRHWEELESIQIQSGYSTVRIIVWAIPILGLLGTVIGITMAVANLNPETLEQSMSRVTHGLGVAFDHTATALALTMVLMFAKAGVERAQDRLLALVDARTSEELVGRFQQSGSSYDPNVLVIRRMSEQVIDAVEALAARQAEVWKSAFDVTHQQWADVNTATGKMVRDSLSTSLKHSLELHAKALGEETQKHVERLAGSAVQYAERLAASATQCADCLATSAAQHAEVLDRGGQETVGRLRDGLEKLAELLVEALHRHGEVLTQGETALAEENREHLSEVQAALGKAMVEAAQRQEHLVAQSEHLLKEMQIALVEAAGASVRQQEELVRQGSVLLKVVDATGQVAKLEDTLNKNLATLQSGYNFEESALALSAAIQLFTARMGTPQGGRAAQIGGEGPVHQAA
jgi:biopolymer transport protein ExbB/TolQ